MINNQEMSEGWGEQLNNWTTHGDYRDFSHKLLLYELEKIKKHEVLLDVGCGTGTLLVDWKNSNRPYLGIDLSDDVIAFHKEKTQLNVLKGNITNLPVSEGYADLTICHGLVEHLPSPADGLRELARVTKVNGTALISVPSKWSVFPLLVPIWYLTGGRYRYSWREMVGRMYSKKTFRKLLESNGWQVDEVQPFKVGSLLDWMRIPFSEKAGVFTEKSKLISSFFGIMLCARCRKIK